MKIDFWYFGSRKFRALYYLLPVVNGALYIAGIEFVYGFLALPAFSPELPGDFLRDFVISTLSMLYGLSHGLVAGCLIAAVNLLILGRFYRRNFFAFLIESWRHSGGKNEPVPAFAAPMFLTLLGDLVAVWSIRLATGAPSAEPPNSGGAFVFVSILYIMWVVPTLVHGELVGQADGAAEERGA